MATLSAAKYVIQEQWKWLWHTINIMKAFRHFTPPNILIITHSPWTWWNYKKSKQNFSISHRRRGPWPLHIIHSWAEWILWAVQEIMAYNFLYDRTLLWFYDANLSHISLHEASKDNRRLALSIVTECTRTVTSITMISFRYSFLNVAPFDIS